MKMIVQINVKMNAWADVQKNAKCSRQCTDCKTKPVGID